jgi:hypothetical protein
MSLQRTKSNTLGSIAAERHHNSTDSQPVAIARLELHIIVLQIFWVAGENNKIEYTYGWYSGSVGINDMHGIITS